MTDLLSLSIAALGEAYRRRSVSPVEVVSATLDRIAARYYGDATRWRPLAAANGVADPLRLVPGTLLAVPGIEDL